MRSYFCVSIYYKLMSQLSCLSIPNSKFIRKIILSKDKHYFFISGNLWPKLLHFFEINNQIVYFVNEIIASKYLLKKWIPKVPSLCNPLPLPLLNYDDINQFHQLQMHSSRKVVLVENVECSTIDASWYTILNFA